ncbi:ubiquitin-associated domain-containing protein 2 isoform X2 [Anguilla rostrata]|uniref:ubiquitin-associated domain-containing protein 2 isoform X2 n=1 Tax=Anguilla rostrata TaxID=7938 RepID=UPI0030D4061E
MRLLCNKAPVTKALLIVPSAVALLLTVVFTQYQGLFLNNLRAVTQDYQVWRLVCGRLVCLDLKDTFCSCLLIYNFRIFERRYGSRKFASFLLGTWVLSALVDVLLAEALYHVFHLGVEVLPSGPLAPVFALFVPFYRTIPRVPVTQVLGHFSLTNKSLVYVVGLQLLTSSPLMWIVSLGGLVSGLVYHCNLLRVQSLLFVPRWVARSSSRLLQPLFSGAEPVRDSALGMGATLDIQRQQRMDQLDQQILLSQFTQMRRNRHQQGGLINWNRFFPSIRHRGRNRHPPAQPQQPAQPVQSAQLMQPAQPNPSERSPVSEEQVAMLMEMGFSRLDALEALRVSNNDLNMATNFLLQH